MLTAQEAPASDVEKTDPEALILIGSESSSQIAQQPVVSTWDFVRMVLVLGGVVGVIYLIVYLLKRGARGRNPENEIIRIMDYRELSGGKALHLVEVGVNVYLVGSAENGVTLVSEIVDKESLDSLRLGLSQRPTVQRRGFSEILAGIFKSGDARNDSISETLGFLQSQKERLKRLR